MATEHGPTGKILDLRDSLSLGIVDVLDRDKPERLEMFQIRADGYIHLTPEFNEKLRGTLGTVWPEKEKDYDEESKDSAIRKFLGLIKNPSKLPFAQGYEMRNEVKIDEADGSSRLTVSLVRINPQPEPRTSSTPADFEDGFGPRMENKPKLADKLIEVVQDWIRDGYWNSLNLFAIENHYISEKPVAITIRLSSSLATQLLNKGFTLDDLGNDQTIEVELADFLRKLTGIEISLRDSTGPIPTLVPTVFEGINLRKKPHEKSPRLTEFSLTKK